MILIRQKSKPRIDDMKLLFFAKFLDGPEVKCLEMTVDARWRTDQFGSKVAKVPTEQKREQKGDGGEIFGAKNGWLIKKFN